MINMEQLYNDILFLMRKENKIICNQQDLPRNTRKRYLRRILIRSLSTLISIYNYENILYSGKLYFHPYNTETEEILRISDAPIHTDIKFKKETFKFLVKNIFESIFLFQNFREIFYEFKFVTEIVFADAELINEPLIVAKLVF